MSEQPPPQGTVVLILGLVGLLICALAAPVAWIMGNNYKRQCEELGVEPDGAGTTGRILGIVGTVLLVLSLCLVGVAVAFGVLGAVVEAS